ncbi:protein UPSTREAM OF FLC isoform X3 [Cucumis sativus]|uniref:protein UPSTREAM OF FLC isoform X3 n=1 Tax=Cucumis sativus TaxID=3659 RepID=UPI0012F4F498|nr:protein UPSTREAM OF FLC isoform X3 [Cucumis sativus]
MEEKDRDHHHRHHRRRDSPTPMKKAQVFYYISRNGRLEQPHFLEIPLFPNHPLRLKGTIKVDMCGTTCRKMTWFIPLKVMNTFSRHLNLLIFMPPVQVHIPNNNPRQPVQEPNLPTKTRKQQLAPTPLPHHPHSDLEYDEDEDYEYDDGDKNAGEPPGTTQTPTESARCSTSKRFALNNDDELGIESGPSRNSVLMQFIGCGGSVGSKGKTVRRTEKGIGKGVVCKMGGNMMREEEMIKYMSENPRLGKLQREEKEYFSGSIVESIREDRHVIPPMLNKSNSYKEEKSKREELEEKKDEDEDEENENENGGIKGRCLPLMILTSTSSKQPKKP